MTAAEEWAAQDEALAAVGQRRVLLSTGGPFGTVLVVCDRCGCAVLTPAVHVDACPAGDR